MHTHIIREFAEVKSTYLPYYDHLFKTIIYDKTFVPSPPLSRFIYSTYTTYTYYNALYGCFSLHRSGINVKVYKQAQHPTSPPCSIGG